MSKRGLDEDIIDKMLLQALDFAHYLANFYHHESFGENHSKRPEAPPGECYNEAVTASQIVLLYTCVKHSLGRELMNSNAKMIGKDGKWILKKLREYGDRQVKLAVDRETDGKDLH